DSASCWSSVTTPSSARSRSRSVPPLLYFSWRATFTCLALARPRPIGSTPPNLRSPLGPSIVALLASPTTNGPVELSWRERGAHQLPYRYNRTRFAAPVPTLRGWPDAASRPECVFG